MTTLGEMIGIIKVNGSITHADGSSVKCMLSIDCSGATDNEIKDWIGANRVIRWANPRRNTMTCEAIENEAKNVFAASDIGKLNHDPVAKMMSKAAGMSKEEIERMIKDLHAIATTK